MSPFDFSMGVLVECRPTRTNRNLRSFRFVRRSLAYSEKRSTSPGRRNILLTRPWCCSSSAIMRPAYSSKRMEPRRAHAPNLTLAVVSFVLHTWDLRVFAQLARSSLHRHSFDAQSRQCSSAAQSCLFSNKRSTSADESSSRKRSPRNRSKPVIASFSVVSEVDAGDQ